MNILIDCPECKHSYSVDQFNPDQAFETRCPRCQTLLKRTQANGSTRLEIVDEAKRRRKKNKRLALVSVVVLWLLAPIVILEFQQSAEKKHGHKRQQVRIEENERRQFDERAEAEKAKQEEIQKLEEQRISRPQRPQRPQQRPTPTIEDHFSSWDGSHRHLTAFVKSRLNDERSFRHVETTYRITNDGYIVYMQYRAKNAYGGVVLQSISARYATDGTPLEVMTLSN
jgi:predicted nucleic acid-binding Zn ribbon protein